MQTTKKIFRISSIFPCLLCVVISLAKETDKFSCDFEDNICQWTQDKSDDFDWTRNRALTPSEGTGPYTDHTKGRLANKKQGPGSIRHGGGKCIHVLLGGFKKPIEGQFLVTYKGCGEDRQEFQLLPNGILMITKHGMCVKPTGRVTDGVKVGVFSSCDATDTWTWTAKGSLQYKKKMCLYPETGSNPRNNVKLVLDSVCDERQNFFEFVPSNSASGWYLYIGLRQPNDKARLVSPSTTKAKSCLLFFYYMYGYGVNELRVYVKSGGKMDPVWSLSGEQGDKWYQAQVAVNNQTTSYQFVIEGESGGYYGDIAIDDISLMDSCPARVSATPAIPSSQTGSEDQGTTDDSSRIIIITTTVGAGVFLSIVLIVLLIKYKRLKRARNLSSPINIPLETNKISPAQAALLPFDEEAVYETVHCKFYQDVATNANESKDISAEGRTSDYEEVGGPSNAHKTSEHIDILKRGATGDCNYQALLKEDDDYVIPAPEEPQHETPGQNETFEETKLSPENPVYTGLDENRLHGGNTTSDGTYQKLIKQDSDYVIPAHEIGESYEDIKMGGNLPDYEELNQSRREAEI